VKRLYLIFIVPFQAIMNTIFISGIIVSLSVFILTSVLVEGILEHPIFKAESRDLDKIYNLKKRTSSFIYDRNGNILIEKFKNFQKFKEYDEIPEKLVGSITSIEDRKFFQHNGIDLFAIMRAGIGLIKTKGNKIKEGGSTITQQVVRNLLLTKEKKFTRKIREIVLSLYLEESMSKKKIFEIYSNIMFLGNHSYGVAAASERYFSKKLDELDYHETALLAGLFQLPSEFDPTIAPEKAKKRQIKVLQAMNDNSIIGSEELKSFSEMTLNYVPYESLHGQRAPYFVDYVLQSVEKILAEKDLNILESGLKVYTSLDPDVQGDMEETLEESRDIFTLLDESLKINAEPAKLIKTQAAMLVIDRRTGEILSMIGGRDYKDSQFNRSVNALRSPASTFKTITYTAALNEGKNWNDLFYISPITIENYRPHTSRSQIFKETTMLKSFYKSINSTAVNLGVDLGMKKVVSFAKRLTGGSLYSFRRF